MASVDLQRLPRHVAIIMDGNGRWAQSQGHLRTLGHREGSHAVRRIVRASRRLGIEALTLFAFSEQNWERPAPEVLALMELLRDYLVSEREELLEAIDTALQLLGAEYPDRAAGPFEPANTLVIARRFRRRD